MQRPLRDKRPIGPFAQSEEFERLLRGNGASQNVNEGDQLILDMLIARGASRNDVFRMAEDVLVVPDLEDFVRLEITGDFNGERNDNQTAGLYLDVDDVRDPDITTDQVAEFIDREITDAIEVNVLKI